MAHQRSAVLPPTVGGDRLGAAHRPRGTAFVDPSEAPAAISGEGVGEESHRWEGISTVRRSGYRRLCGVDVVQTGRSHGGVRPQRNGQSGGAIVARGSGPRPGDG
jgi:hypothetical protein